MLLTISTTHEPATDLGLLLHKHPARLQTFELAFGRAHVFYPEARPERCTVALLLEVDPVGLVRRRAGGEGMVDQYVNDRPFAANSLLSSAIAQVFGSALGGRCSAAPALAERALPLEARLAALPCRGGASLLESLFAPLGYRVTAERLPLDPAFPEWGDSPYHEVTLAREGRLKELLSHLYVLVPVLDDRKHYWVSDDEIEKLLRHGEGWLATHPLRDTIASRYLRHQRGLVRSALARLVQEEDPAAAEGDDEDGTPPEEALEGSLSLNEQRIDAVVQQLLGAGATRILDLGCGEGKLLKALLKQMAVTRVVGMDVSSRALEVAARRLRLESLPEAKRERVGLMLGSLLYRDRRLEGYDAAALVEVIEHMDPPRLAALERVVFDGARPPTVVVTTPNAEYNALWPSLPAGRFRHADHRFEWTRAQFQAWSSGVASRFGYAVRHHGVGPAHAEFGAPTQMATFARGA